LGGGEIMAERIDHGKRVGASITQEQARRRCGNDAESKFLKNVMQAGFSSTRLLPVWGPHSELEEGPISQLNAWPALFTAIQEQLGLKLEAQKADVKVLVVDHVDHPSPN
jgi:Protein of unknown function (DUF3738)